MTTATKTVLVDGIACAMPEMEANIVQRHISALTDSAAKLKTDLEAANAKVATVTTDATTKANEAKAISDTKDAEIATLKKQLADAEMSPAKLDSLVTERLMVVQKAKAVVADGLVVDGKTIADIMKQVVLASVGDGAKDWNDSMVKASFDTLTAKVDLSKVNDGSNGIADLSNGIKLVTQNGANLSDKAAVEKGYTNYDKNLSERWKQPAAK